MTSELDFRLRNMGWYVEYFDPDLLRGGSDVSEMLQPNVVFLEKKYYTEKKNLTYENQKNLLRLTSGRFIGTPSAQMRGTAP